MVKINAGSLDAFAAESNIIRTARKNKLEGNITYPYNVSNPAYPLVRDSIEYKGNDSDTLKSQLKSWVYFDLGFKALGLAFKKAFDGINYLRGIPVNPANAISLCDRFFTPNKVGYKIGYKALKQAQNKVLPEIITKPLVALENSVRKAMGAEGIKLAAKGGFINSTLKPLFKFSGAPLMIVFELLGDISEIVKDFKTGQVTGLKQLGKSLIKAGINTASFCGGEIVGTGIGSFVGGAIGSVIPVMGTAIGAQIGGWLGGLVGGCTASYYSNKFVKTFIKPESEIKSKKPQLPAYV